MYVVHFIPPPLLPIPLPLSAPFTAVSLSEVMKVVESLGEEVHGEEPGAAGGPRSGLHPI